VDGAAPVMPLEVFLRRLPGGRCWHHRTGLFHILTADLNPLSNPAGYLWLAQSLAGH